MRHIRLFAVVALMPMASFAATQRLRTAFSPLVHICLIGHSIPTHADNVYGLTEFMMKSRDFDDAVKPYADESGQREINDATHQKEWTLLLQELALLQDSIEQAKTPDLLSKERTRDLTVKGVKSILKRKPAEADFRKRPPPAPSSGVVPDAAPGLTSGDLEFRSP